MNYSITLLWIIFYLSLIPTNPTTQSQSHHYHTTIMDPKLNSLLKWSIQNQGNTTDNNNNVVESASRGLNPEVLSSLFGGPSDADLMKSAMAALYSPDVDLENKMIAFDNFEQLIESLDNANNMEPLGLWTPLVQLLSHEEADMRRMAAWCVGTAVQNNEKSQDKVCPSSPFLSTGLYTGC